MWGDHGAQRAEIAESVFGFKLEVSGEDAMGGIVLKTGQSEFGAATLEPVMAAGIGEGHHAKARARRTGRSGIFAGAVSVEKPVLRRVRCGVQSHG